MSPPLAKPPVAPGPEGAAAVGRSGKRPAEGAATAWRIAAQYAAQGVRRRGWYLAFLCFPIPGCRAVTDFLRSANRFLIAAV